MSAVKLQELPPTLWKARLGKGVGFSPVDTGEALWTPLQGHNIIRVLSEAKRWEQTERLGNQIPSVQTRITKAPNWVNGSVLAN